MNDIACEMPVLMSYRHSMGNSIIKSIWLGI